MKSSTYIFIFRNWDGNILYCRRFGGSISVGCGNGVGSGIYGYIAAKVKGVEKKPFWRASGKFEYKIPILSC